MIPAEPLKASSQGSWKIHAGRQSVVTKCNSITPSYWHNVNARFSFWYRRKRYARAEAITRFMTVFGSSDRFAIRTLSGRLPC